MTDEIENSRTLDLLKEKTTQHKHFGLLTEELFYNNKVMKKQAGISYLSSHANKKFKISRTRVR